MAINLYQANKQWAMRPADERFNSLDGLYNFAASKKKFSSQHIKPLNSISLESNINGDLTINGDNPKSTVSNWAFGQLCRQVGAPANYLRTISADLAIDCLHYGLRNNNTKTKVLYREDKNSGNRFASAFTGTKYGRIWDSDVIESLEKSIQGNGWIAPEDYKGNPGGLYASDRDMFIFMVNSDNPVSIANSKLGKGFFCWNSETGSQTFGFTTFLYNYICGNHIVWGAEQVRELKIIHKSQAVNRFYNEAIPSINRFVEQKNISDSIRASVDKAMNTRIGNNQEEILNWFKSRDFTKKEVLAGYDSALKEGESPHQLWGIVQGLTAFARDIPYIDKRVNLERRAGSLLK